MRKNKNEILLAIARLSIGEPVSAMEAAKYLIVHKVRESVEVLGVVAQERAARPWSRVAATYALGMLGDRRAVEVLIRILGSNRNSIRLRSHAAEALGYHQAVEAIDLLEQSAISCGPRSDLRRSCLFAL